MIIIPMELTEADGMREIGEVVLKVLADADHAREEWKGTPAEAGAKFMRRNRLKREERACEVGRTADGLTTEDGRKEDAAHDSHPR